MQMEAICSSKTLVTYPTTHYCILQDHSILSHWCETLNKCPLQFNNFWDDVVWHINKASPIVVIFQTTVIRCPVQESGFLRMARYIDLCGLNGDTWICHHKVCPISRYLDSLYTQMDGSTFIALSHKKSPKSVAWICTPVDFYGVIGFIGVDSYLDHRMQD
jgi:hypothetical protein